MKANFTRKVSFIVGTQSRELRKSILQDFGNSKTNDFLKKDAPKVVNQ
jgi:hypothetical protein